MTLLRVHTREVYHVYTEDEFLHGAADGFTHGSENEFLDGVRVFRASQDRTTSDGVIDGRLLRRAGAGILAAAVGAVGSVIAANGLRRTSSAADWRAKRGSLQDTGSHVAGGWNLTAHASIAMFPHVATFSSAAHGHAVTGEQSARAAWAVAAHASHGHWSLRRHEGDARRLQLVGAPRPTGVELGTVRSAIATRFERAALGPLRPRPAEFGFEH